MLVSVRWVSAINAHFPIGVKVAAQRCNNQPFGCPSLSSPFSYSSPAQLGQLDVQALLRGPNVPGTDKNLAVNPSEMDAANDMKQMKPTKVAKN